MILRHISDEVPEDVGLRTGVSLNLLSDTVFKSYSTGSSGVTLVQMMYDGSLMLARLSSQVKLFSVHTSAASVFFININIYVHFFQSVQVKAECRLSSVRVK